MAPMPITPITALFLVVATKKAAKVLLLLTISNTVGAYMNDGVNGYDSGHAWVYEGVNETWTQEVGNDDIDGGQSDGDA